MYYVCYEHRLSAIGPRSSGTKLALHYHSCSLSTGLGQIALKHYIVHRPLEVEYIREYLVYIKLM